ncbi:MAG: NAD(P)-binding domain-containing protein [Vicinamibacteria bacterium]
MSFESVVWLASIAVAAAIVLPYVVAFRKKRTSDRARKAEAARLGVDRPTAQFPFVDATRCIGCGSCVEACPEGDVLGIVGGTATVVNGLKCVGHGRCEIACPVGAIEVGLGDLKSRKDIPLLDDWQETSVPGVYIAGELGGLALVKNAIAQARRAIDRIAQKAPTARKGSGQAFDVLVVGAGPAGLAAAAAARERGLTHVVLEQEGDLGGTIFHYPRKKLVLVQAIDVPVLGRLREAEYAKEDLLGLFQGLCSDAPLNVRFGERLAGIDRQGGLLAVRSTSGVTLARAVVLALGRRGTPRKLGVPGEELPKVMYQLTDAESYQGHHVLVVGGGDSAVEAAIGLARQRGNRVTLSYRREKLVRIKRKNEERIGQLLANRRIEGAFSSEVTSIRPTSVTLKTAAGEREMPNDYVFVFAGGEPPFELLRQIGVRFGGEKAPAPARALTH